jgi:hypothetical protein
LNYAKTSEVIEYNDLSDIMLFIPVENAHGVVNSLTNFDIHWNTQSFEAVRKALYVIGMVPDVIGNIPFFLKHHEPKGSEQTKQILDYYLFLKDIYKEIAGDKYYTFADYKFHKIAIEQ